MKAVTLPFNTFIAVSKSNFLIIENGLMSGLTRLPSCMLYPYVMGLIPIGGMKNLDRSNIIHAKPGIRVLEIIGIG